MPINQVKYEVAQAQWQSVMGNNPSNFKNCGGNCPVEQVSWNDAQVFINKLNERNDGFKYRLPSEAEWEYSCRAGTTGDYAGQPKCDGLALGGTDSSGGRETAERVGPFDMHGNVFEWCEDWFHESYNGAPTDGSAWIAGGAIVMGDQKYRIKRGGSNAVIANYLRSAFASPADLIGVTTILGFGLLRFA